jgi:hypothetical protein
MEQVIKQFHETVELDEREEAERIDNSYVDYRQRGNDYESALKKATDDAHDSLTYTDDYSSMYGYPAVRAATRWCTFRGLFIEHIITNFADESGEIFPESRDHIYYARESQQVFEDMVVSGNDTVIKTFEALEKRRESLDRFGKPLEDPLGAEAEAAMDTARRVFDSILRPLALISPRDTIKFTFQSPQDGSNSYLIRHREGAATSYALSTFEVNSNEVIRGEDLVMQFRGEDKEFSFEVDGSPVESDALMLLTAASLLYELYQESHWSPSL